MIVCCLRAGDLPRDVGSFYLQKYHKTHVRKVGLSLLIGSLLQQLIIAGAWQQILKKVIEIGFFLSGNVQMNLIRDTSYQTLHIHWWFKWHAVFVNRFILYVVILIENLQRCLIEDML